MVLHTLCFPHITTYKEDHCIVHTEILTIAMASVGKLHFKEIFQIFRHWQHFLHGLFGGVLVVVDPRMGN